jgi:hypothetical protein
MIKKETIITSIVIVIIFFGFFASQAYAALNLQNAFKDDFGAPLGKVGAYARYDTVTTSLPGIIGDIIFIVFSILGIMFVMLMVYGGYLWMTAMGNETQVTKAKDSIQAAVIGIIIMAGAYAISYFVTNALVSPFIKPKTTGTMETQPITSPTPAPSPDDTLPDQSSNPNYR